MIGFFMMLNFDSATSTQRLDNYSKSIWQMAQRVEIDSGILIARSAHFMNPLPARPLL